MLRMNKCVCPVETQYRNLACDREISSENHGLASQGLPSDDKR